MSTFRVDSFTPGDRLAVAHLSGPLALTPWEQTLLRADHPFLTYGHWRGFVVRGYSGAEARLVAAIDPRQHSASRPVGTIGFIAETPHSSPISCRRDMAPAEATRARQRGPLTRAFAAAEAWLRDNGAVVARAPVQLSTWYGHRLALAEERADPTFPMEPASAPGVGCALAGRGYAVAHRAVSHVVPNDPAIAGGQRGLDRMLAAGYRDRGLDVRRLEDELTSIHAVSQAAFTRSWGHSEISPDEFLAIYLPIARFTDPELVRVVEDAAGRLVAFAFAFEIPAVSNRDEGTATTIPDGVCDRGHIDITNRHNRIFVLKSIAVAPDISRRAPGIGSALVARLHTIARDRGCQAGIHALMAEGSYAQRTSARWGSKIREYATFERDCRFGADQ